MPKLKETTNPLLRQLTEHGIARPFFNGSFHPCGLDISENFNLINSDDKVQKNIFALGTPTEGAKFYTFILPRPFVNSTALVDADRAVSFLFEDISQNQTKNNAMEFAL